MLQLQVSISSPEMFHAIGFASLSYRKRKHVPPKCPS